jgi:hypothetical protein
MAKQFTAPVVVVGLLGGFVAGRTTGRRDVGGVVFGAAGAWCARSWFRSHSPAVAGSLLAVYLGALGVSHPLAKKIGPWPSVLGVTAAAASAAYVFADRSRRIVGTSRKQIFWRR